MCQQHLFDQVPTSTSESQCQSECAPASYSRPQTQSFCHMFRKSSANFKGHFTVYQIAYTRKAWPDGADLTTAKSSRPQNCSQTHTSMWSDEAIPLLDALGLNKTRSSAPRSLPQPRTLLLYEIGLGSEHHPTIARYTVHGRRAASCCKELRHFWIRGPELTAPSPVSQCRSRRRR